MCLREPAQGVPPPRPRVVPLRPDTGVSEVIGALLLTLVSFIMIASFSQMLSDAQPRPTVTVPVEAAISADPGLSLWGTGDETITVRHTGGSALDRARTSVRIHVGTDVEVLEGAALLGGFTDGALTIGETWTHSRDIPPGSQVVVQVVQLSSPVRVLSESFLRIPTADCTGDTLAPTVAYWTQAPDDVHALIAGEITVTVTLEDDCAGLAGAIEPHLAYVLDDGSGPSFTDLGPMTQLSTAIFQGTIPEPVTGWGDHADETLVYKVTNLADANGNTGESVERTDAIESSGAGGIVTYVARFNASHATVSDFPAAQNGTDGGAEAAFQENSTGSGSLLSELYGTAHTSSGAQAPGNATGAPDDQRAVLDADLEWVGVKGFNTFAGAITSVEFAFDGHTTGTRSGASDDLVLSYAISGAEGATTQTIALADLPSGSDGAPVFTNVTADRASWSWTDIANLQVKAEYKARGTQDAATIEVDALWVRLRYIDTGYNLTARLHVDAVPAGSTQALELRYRATGDTYAVEVWNFTANAWVRHGAWLDEPLSTGWTILLDPDEIASGEVRLRVVDRETTSGAAGTLYLDHVRVRTT